MGYYQGDDRYAGDYYAGDYYSGDPLPIALLARGAAKFGRKLLPKAGKLILRGARAVGRVARRPRVRAIARAAGPIVAFETGERIVSGVRRSTDPADLIREAARGVSAGRARGFAAGGRMMLPGRRRRRINPANVRALRRAGRRLKAFTKIAKMAIRFTTGRKPKGVAVLKTRRKS